MMTMPQRILIADDEETFRESTVEILAEAGYALEEELLLERALATTDTHDGLANAASSVLGARAVGSAGP